MGGFLLLLVFGLNPDSDVIAHIGGFLAGVFFFGALLSLTESPAPTTRSPTGWQNRSALAQWF